MDEEEGKVLLEVKGTVLLVSTIDEAGIDPKYFKSGYFAYFGAEDSVDPKIIISMQNYKELPLFQSTHIHLLTVGT